MKKKNLLILGAGQYGRVARETAAWMGCFGKIEFLDDQSPLAVGKLMDYDFLAKDYDSAFVAMGDPRLRRYWLEQLEQKGYDLPVLIHPRAYVSDSAVLGKGTIAEPMAVVNPEAVIGMGVLLCAGCVVNHNARVSAFCQIDCSAVVESNAVVPEGTKVPSGTVFHRK